MNFTLHLYRNDPATNALLLACDIFLLHPNVCFHSKDDEIELDHQHYSCPFLIRESSPPSTLCKISDIVEKIQNCWNEQVKSTVLVPNQKRLRDPESGEIDKVYFFGHRSNGRKLVFRALKCLDSLDSNWKKFCCKYLSPQIPETTTTTTSSSSSSSSSTTTLFPTLTEIPIEFLLMAHTLRKNKFVGWHYISVVDFLVFPYVHTFVKELQERLKHWIPVCIEPLTPLWKWFSELQQRPEVQHFQNTSFGRELTPIDVKSWLLSVCGRSLDVLFEDVRHPKHINLVTTKHTTWRENTTLSSHNSLSTFTINSSNMTCSNILTIVQNKLSTMSPGLSVQYSDNTKLGIPLDWSVLPSACDPSEGQVPSTRAHRKRQQISNIYRLLQQFLRVPLHLLTCDCC
jgi:hypothetical protein